MPLLPSYLERIVFGFWDDVWVFESDGLCGKSRSDANTKPGNAKPSPAGSAGEGFVHVHFVECVVERILSRPGKEQAEQ
jgi:hypothetical protein